MEKSKNNEVIDIEDSRPVQNMPASSYPPHNAPKSPMLTPSPRNVFEQRRSFPPTVESAPNPRNKYNNSTRQSHRPYYEQSQQQDHSSGGPIHDSNESYSYNYRNKRKRHSSPSVIENGTSNRGSNDQFNPNLRIQHEVPMPSFLKKPRKEHPVVNDAKLTFKNFAGNKNVLEVKIDTCRLWVNPPLQFYLSLLFLNIRKFVSYCCI